ncbi:MAG TPA: type III-B CRISPR module RAMP protein Cmr4, partial [Polyangiaceae bacterium]|nr:type III-B CRISPR module RAMP protein Cmr4 [Polyangiaceae bacterium]
MYEAKELMFIYCVSPVHMGAGTALGAIDSPIQRERHTQHPMMAGTGIKGALRHTAWERWHVRDEKTQGDAGERGKNGKARLTRLFGPDTRDAPEHAGAVAFSDAALVLFPVRSLCRSFVYATCPTALARLERLATMAGIGGYPKLAALPERDEAIVHNQDLVTTVNNAQNVVLEAFALTRKTDPKSPELARWIASRVVPDGAEHDYFREKVETDLVVLHDDRFNFFVRNSTVVEPHVRIDDESGTASDGGLFYVENLPPESVLVSLVMASPERRSNDAEKGNGGARLSATDLLADLRQEFGGK